MALLPKTNTDFIGSTSNQSTASILNDPTLEPDASATKAETELGEEFETVDVAILRIKLSLNNMVRDRALHGIQQGDTAAAVEIALDALKLSRETSDETASVRVSFWLGVALYYNGDIDAAHSYFHKANKSMVLPEYEAGYVEGWLERCSGSGRKDALSL